jgi:hypothetical protein
MDGRLQLQLANARSVLEGNESEAFDTAGRVVRYAFREVQGDKEKSQGKGRLQDTQGGAKDADASRFQGTDFMVHIASL